MLTYIYHMKELAPYLPYRLKGLDYDKKIYLFRGLNEHGNLNWESNIKLDKKGYDIKPILRPLSDLFNGNYENILDEFSDVELDNFKFSIQIGLNLNIITYTQFELLVSNHFDVFGLIKDGLAVDINTL